ncbi:MAG TPA: DMT family transporter [Bacteroidales bacterium]|nr:DMT family transporter [Bacteroidales bacterium]
MLFIALSVIQSVLILITFKLFDRFRIDNLQAIVTNYIIAAFFGFLTAGTTWSFKLLPHNDWFLTAIFLGFLFIGTFFLFALSSQKIGVAITSVTSKMSLIIPVTVSILLLGESVNLFRIAGIVLAFAAFYFSLKQNEPIRWNSRYTYLPFLVLAGNGLVDTTMKLADHYYISDDVTLFLSVVFSTSFLIGAAILVYRILRRKTILKLKNLAGGVILGSLNFGSTYYMLKAISSFESSVVFPVTNAAIVGISGLAGFFIFREKLAWINWLGITLAILAILIISKA